MDLYNFDRNGIFYPLVMNYYASLHGTIDLFSRYHIRNFISSEPIDKTKDYRDEFLNKIKQIENPENRPLIGKLGPFSHFLNKAVYFEIEDIENEFGSNPLSILDYVFNAGGILLISAYARIGINANDYDESLLNFLYHCRNGVAHGGKFTGMKAARFPATFGNLEITNSLAGTNVFKDEEQNGLLGYGDPIHVITRIGKKLLTIE